MLRTGRPLLTLGLALAVGVCGFGDDIVKRDGEVVTGDILEEATKAANKGKPAGEHVYVIQVDEAGKQRTIKKSEVQYVMQKKADWILRKEALRWYEKYSKKVKETRAGHESFGRSCRARGLADKAEQHMMKALTLKRGEMKEKGKNKQKDHVSLAQWCRRNGLLEDEEKELKTVLDMKIKAANEHKQPGRQLMQVASWCARNSMEKDAIKLYEKVVAMEPENRSAKNALEKIKNKPKFAMAHVVNEYVQAKRGWKVTVAIQENANAAFMKEWEQKLKDLSDFIWEVTEGQFFIYEWVLEDQLPKAQVIIEKGKMDWQGMNGKRASGTLAYCRGVGSPGWEVHCPGKVWVSVLAHEMFHGIFGLLDEYYQKPQCPCVMRSAPCPQKLCVSSSHKGGGRQKGPCVDTIKKRYSDVTFPNPRWTWTESDGKGDRKNGTTVEVAGFLKIGSAKVDRAPSCVVKVIDK